MNRLLSCSSAVYQRLLFLYPQDLREEFGSEMTLAFADDLQSAWSDGEVTRVLRIWWSALCEIGTVALPGQQSNRYVLVPTLCFLMVAVSEGPLVWVFVQHARLAFQVLPVLLMSLLAGMVGFVVAHFCSRCPLDVVRLD